MTEGSMMKKQSIICDVCEKELSIDRGTRRGVSVGIIDYGFNSMNPPNRDLDFCGYMCLSKWLEDRNIDLESSKE